jgi:hypothetical protein
MGGSGGCREVGIGGRWDFIFDKTIPKSSNIVYEQQTNLVVVHADQVWLFGTGIAYAMR